MKIWQTRFFVPNTKEEYIFNLDGLNFINLVYAGKELIFLLDSGASISAIFSNVLPNEENVDYSKSVKISGISGSLFSQGVANIQLNILNNITLNHDFHVINNFNSRMHGILGDDFLKKYLATINYETSEFSFSIQDQKVVLPMQSKNDNSVIIPARCEVIRFFDIGNLINECIVSAQEIGNGVYVAGSIAKLENSKIPVKILNTREEDVILKNFTPRFSDK